MPRIVKRIVALDTETTGIDFHHGSRPHSVTICNEDGENTYWEWDVDPMTRMPIVPVGDLREIQDEIDRAGVLVLQNPKFDAKALSFAFRDAGMELRWDWSKVRDTLLAGHLLRSDEAHDLTSMVQVYLGMNIKPLEDALEAAVNECRRVARSKFPDWRIAKKGLPEIPSAGNKLWVMDMWLPRTIARFTDLSDDHPWRSVGSDYMNCDSASTLPLYQRMEELLREKHLVRIYLERLRLLPIVYEMESRGVSLNRRRMVDLRQEYLEASEKSGSICKNIAKSYGVDLHLPKSGNNKSLSGFVFETLRVPVKKTSKKTGAPSFDQEFIRGLLRDLPPRGKQKMFFENLQGKRKRDTALSYMESYERFMRPMKVPGKEWFILYPLLNPTGSRTLRFSSQNPNEQNISKQEGFNLRYMFGPAPGREWYSIDYQNLELRIPSYAAGEQAAIDVFENPDDPPFYGSYHLLTCEAAYPEKFNECIRRGESFKDKFPSIYKGVKSGNFAVIYGAQESTADRTYGVDGAYQKIRQRLPGIARLSDEKIAEAQEHGYVETMPDKTVDPRRGYPLYCERSTWGSISPTVPLNYYVQGTAMWVTMKAMIRVQEYLDREYNQDLPSGQGFIVMQVHDELVLDLPVRRENTVHVLRIASLMELSGDDIGVPTPVTIERHGHDWSGGDHVAR